MSTPKKVKELPPGGMQFKCPLCKDFFNEAALRAHKCPCLMDGHRRPRRLLDVQVERILANG